ncbi:MAG: 3-dehydroquinate synthase [Lutispora sp.]|nr:3-dehydroquinate synthase [Lutispora sp.]
MKIVDVKTDFKAYPIYIQRGIINDCGKIIKDIYSDRKVYIVTDTNVDKLYGERLVTSLRQEGFEAFIAKVEPGESSKSFQSFEKLCSSLLKGGITRGDLIIAFGGGVVGDLGGFAASALLRGIKYIQVPTTLIAQVDSSIGGKVGININEGKNLIGNFHQPEAVIIDPELLTSLNKRYLADGMGEVIKYACIKDRGLFQLLKEKDKALSLENFDNIIGRCCKIKADLVEADEKDKGQRMLLNFGHTIGHAIEKYYDYSKYSHGEAVAIGTLHITAKAETMDLTPKGTQDKIFDLLKSYKLPCELPYMDKAKIREIVLLDKKGSSDDMKIILLKDIGEGYIHSIKKDEIDKWL